MEKAFLEGFEKRASFLRTTAQIGTGIASHLTDGVKATAGAIGRGVKGVANKTRAVFNKGFGEELKTRNAVKGIQGDFSKNFYKKRKSDLLAGKKAPSAAMSEQIVSREHKAIDQRYRKHIANGTTKNFEYK